MPEGAVQAGCRVGAQVVQLVLRQVRENAVPPPAAPTGLPLGTLTPGAGDAAQAVSAISGMTPSALPELPWPPLPPTGHSLS